jgi:hypothetical protein
MVVNSTEFNAAVRLATIFKEIDRTFALRARAPLEKTA